MNKNIKIIGNYVLGPLVFLVLAWFIRQQIIHQADWRTSLDQILLAIKGPGQWRLWLVLVLMPVNWGIEARKWQLAMRPDGGIVFKDAFKAIFTGTTMASFTPNRMGDYLGRILYVREGRRVAAISLTMICSMAQLLVTLVAGAAGLIYLFPLLQQQASADAHRPEWGLPLSLIIVVAMLTGLGILYFRFPQLARKLARVSWIRRLGAFIKF